MKKETAFSDSDSCEATVNIAAGSCNEEELSQAGFRLGSRLLGDLAIAVLALDQQDPDRAWYGGL
jgi:hypothetical protein